MARATAWPAAWFGGSVSFKTMGELTDRAYAGVADLRRMEELLARGYASTSLRVGDISWMSRDHTHRELALDIRLWHATSIPTDLVAFAYFRSNGEFNVFVAPDSRHADDASLCDELLGFMDSAWRALIAAGDPPVTLTTYAIDPSRSTVDRSLAAALERAGFECDDSGSAGALVRSLDDLEEPRLPDGYYFDWVRTPELMAGRVEAHRAAFAPSGPLHQTLRTRAADVGVSRRARPAGGVRRGRGCRVLHGVAG